MSDDNKNQGEEFEDDLDDLEFDDVELDDDAGYEDISDADLQQDDQFGAEEEWEEDFPEDEAQPQPAGRRFGKEKNLYTDTRERKGLNLSFNTMVIIGAVLLGGSVLAYTIMTETAEVNASRPAAYRSMLNISAVLDGSIFGGGDETPEQSPETAGTETPTIPDQTQNDGAQGFLDNPDQALPDNAQADIPVVEGAPPAPTPISPTEDVITPLPDEQNVPRGPEETPVESAQESATSIIEAALANRENKGNADEASITPEPAVEETPSDIPDVTALVPPPVAEQSAPQPAGPSEEDKAKMAQAEQRANEAEGKVADLQKQIADLQSRLGSMEGELDAARSSNSTESSALEKSVATLRADLKAANDKAEKEKAAREAAEAKAAQAKKDADAAKKKADAAAATAKEAAAKEAAAEKKAELAVREPAPVKKAPSKTASTSSTPKKAPVAESRSARWELRAAQPGRAWVSKPGARDMQSVTIGETLQGIGRVTSISYINGRWTVQGTQGQVVQ